MEIFPAPLAQMYTGEVLLALQHLHERQGLELPKLAVRNIVYRDLKPDNVSWPSESVDSS